MWRSAALIRETGVILKPRSLALGQFPRKLRASRFLLSKECPESLECPEACAIPSPMDQIPVRNGPWQKKFDEDTKESNQVLLISTGFFLTTLIAMHVMGAVPGYDVPYF